MRPGQGAVGAQPETQEEGAREARGPGARRRQKGFEEEIVRDSAKEAAMFPLSKGKVSKQAHVGLPDGTYEEEHGREAFDGRASHLYRTHLPTAWVRIEGPLRPRAYDLNGIKPSDMTEG